jgi:CheY-like chemotaxis protein
LLVAEDNELNRQIAIELLESAGAAVDVAVDGDEAVEKVLGAAGVRYDAVLMDVQMPAWVESRRRRRSVATRGSPRCRSSRWTSHALAEGASVALAAGMQETSGPSRRSPPCFSARCAAWCKTRSAPRARVPAVRSAAAFPAIAGVDTKAGFEEGRRKPRLYAQLLRQYVERHAEAAVSVRASLDRGDRRPHNASRIWCGASRQYRSRCGAGVGRRAGEGDSLRPRLQIASCAVRSRAERTAREHAQGAGAADEERAQPEVAVSAEQLRPMLEQLAALLQARDGEAIDLLSARQSVFRSACGSRYRTWKRPSTISILTRRSMCSRRPPSDMTSHCEPLVSVPCTRPGGPDDEST